MNVIAPFLAYPLYYYIAYKMTEGYVRRFGPVWYHGLIIGIPAVILCGPIATYTWNIPMTIGRILFWIGIFVVKDAYAKVKSERQGGDESADEGCEREA